MQIVGKMPVVLIPEVMGHQADPVAAYRDLLASPTTPPNQPLLTVTIRGKQAEVTVDMFTRALKVVLDAFGVDTSLYSPHSMRRGVPRLPTGQESTNWIYIKHHSMWAS